MDLNKVMLIGNLTRDPETRTIPSGQTVTSFGLATNRVWTDASGQKQEVVEFHNIVAWRRLAEICDQYLRKGSKIYIEGRLQTRSWDGQDGIKRYRTEIIANNMIMLGSKGSISSSPSTPSQTPTDNEEGAPSTPEPTTESSIPEIQIEDNEPSASPSPNPNSNEEVNVEEVPF